MCTSRPLLLRSLCVKSSPFSHRPPLTHPRLYSQIDGRLTTFRQSRCQRLFELFTRNLIKLFWRKFPGLFHFVCNTLKIEKGASYFVGFLKSLHNTGLYTRKIKANYRLFSVGINH